MPSSVIIHAAYFAAGAVIGGGIVTAVSKKRQIRSIPSPQFSAPTVDLRQSGTIIPPIVEIGTGGDARITNAAAVMTLAPPVLKYGNPGEYIFIRVAAILILVNIGPISDMLVRKAYVAAYDRRLRHPAWVIIYLFHIPIMLTIS
jgi:endonuclease G, mitochondrial